MKRAAVASLVLPCVALAAVVAWQIGGRTGSGAAAGSAYAAEPPASPVPAGSGADPAEALWQHRNLGKAFYENPTTQAQAVEELRQALALAPGSARERLNYGLALLKAGRTAEGIAELERVQRQDPALGVLYKLVGKAQESLAEFETAARLAPRLAGPHFQLFNAYKVAGRAADATRELAAFQEIKKLQAGAAVPEDLEWSYYAEIYDPSADKLAAGQAAGGAAAPAPVVFEPRELARGLDPATAGLLVLDVDGTGRPALLAWSAAGIRLWRGGPAADRAEAPPGLEALRGVVDVAAGDFNNDGLPDLCVVTASGGLSGSTTTTTTTSTCCCSATPPRWPATTAPPGGATTPPISRSPPAGRSTPPPSTWWPTARAWTWW